jgi:hypothetical protein
MIYAELGLMKGKISGIFHFPSPSELGDNLPPDKAVRTLVANNLKRFYYTRGKKDDIKRK